MITRRLAAALAALPLLAACSVTVGLFIDKPVSIQAPAGAFEKTLQIDPLSYSEVVDHRGNVDHVSIDEVRVEVTALNPGHQATAVSLTLRLRPQGAPADGRGDLVLGAIDGLAFTQGSLATLPGSNALDEFLLSAVKDGTPFTVLAAGTLDGAADAQVEVQFKGSLVYAVGLF